MKGKCDSETRSSVEEMKQIFIRLLGEIRIEKRWSVHLKKIMRKL